MATCTATHTGLFSGATLTNQPTEPAQPQNASIPPPGADGATDYQGEEHPGRGPNANGQGAQRATSDGQTLGEIGVSKTQSYARGSEHAASADPLYFWGIP
jgi:hypothetical protein